MDSPNIIRRITDNHPALRKSEAKVADFVLAHANDVINMRIVDLAAQSEVSEPTVIRFCRALGFDGFQSFKLQLAQQIGMGSVYTQFAVDDSDTVNDLCSKVFDTTVAPCGRCGMSWTPTFWSRLLTQSTMHAGSSSTVLVLPVQ